MRRTISLVTLLSLLALLAAGCGKQSAGQSFSNDSRLKVVTSFYPMYEFTQAIGGDRVEVVNLVSPGAEPHDWEPTAQHMQSLNAAAVFIYNGAGMEHWVEKTLQATGNKSLIVVEAAHGIEMAESLDDGHGHADELDPHVWLNPLNVVRQAEAIRDALAKADPANAATYAANAAAYIEKLEALDREYRTALTDSCGRREFFTSHAAFGYLAAAYGLEQHAIMGLSPEAEPRPQDLAKVIEEAREEGVKHIFFETLVSDKVSKVVAREIGAETLVLNPFEGLTQAEVKAGKDYFAVMRENLANLKIALECGK